MSQEDNQAEDNVRKLPMPKSDAEKAADLKAACKPHLEALAKLMDLAVKEGMFVQWQFGINSFGQRYVQDFTIAKLL